MRRREVKPSQELVQLLGGDPLAVQVGRTLATEGVITIEDFMAVSMTGFRDMRYVGDKSLERIRTARKQLRRTPIVRERDKDYAVLDYVEVERTVEALLERIQCGDGAFGFGTSGIARDELMRLVNLGKIIGRRTAYGEGNEVNHPEQDAMIVSWLRAVNDENEET